MNLTEAELELDDVRLHYTVAGSGPLVVLLHGWPETGRCWAAVQQHLAADFTVVAPDLRGHGASGLASTGYDKRAMARDLSRLVTKIGAGSALVAGHDRGARVAHRWALDRPDQVHRLAVLAILPTREVLHRWDSDSAGALWHWHFHRQPGIAESLLDGRMREYLAHFLRRPRELGVIDDATFEWYVEAYGDPARTAAFLEDYRTSFGIDAERDDYDRQRGRRITVPVHALWGSEGNLAGTDVVAAWRDYAVSVTGVEVAGAAHHLPDEQPAAVAAELRKFFDS